MAAGLWQAVQGASKIAGRLLGLARRIPIIDDGISRLQSNFFSPVVTRLVKQPDDLDLDAALDLYQARIPGDQQFEAADIVRWLREDATTRDDGGPSDWFLVAKFRKKVCGFVLFHYYPAVELAFFAYMVTSRTPGIPVNAISRSLATEISSLLRKRKELKGYRGFVLEVEDPRREVGKRKQEESLGRMRRFCTLAEMQGFTLRAFDFGYKQPKLSLDPKSTERPMLLLSARRRNSDSESRRREVEEVLKFIYANVYPEGFSADLEENTAYRNYCATLLAEETERIPSHVRWLGCADLAAQLGRKKANK